jgi:DNA-binding transcriptional LysR family regulator
MNHVLMSDLLSRLERCPWRHRFRIAGFLTALVKETVAEPIAAGRLTPLLERWSAPFPGYFLCYPQQRQMAPALRAFIDAVRWGISVPAPGDARSS